MADGLVELESYGHYEQVGMLRMHIGAYFSVALCRCWLYGLRQGSCQGDVGGLRIVVEYKASLYGKFVVARHEKVAHVCMS